MNAGLITYKTAMNAKLDRTRTRCRAPWNSHRMTWHVRDAAEYATVGATVAT